MMNQAEGMSQREIGDVLGVDQKTVSNDGRVEENSSKKPERHWSAGWEDVTGPFVRTQADRHQLVPTPSRNEILIFL